MSNGEIVSSTTYVDYDDALIGLADAITQFYRDHGSGMENEGWQLEITIELVSPQKLRELPEMEELD